MPVAWRVAKQRHPAFDGTGAMLNGGRWNSPGRMVVYAADTFAGAILEILAHASRPRTLPGPHHAVRLEFAEDMSETIDAEALPGWDTRGSPEALRYGDRWLDDGRTAVLVVPAVASRPVGNLVIINPDHPDARRIAVSEPFAVPWDERLF